MTYLKGIILFIFISLFHSCANIQQPPFGSEDIALGSNYIKDITSPEKDQNLRELLLTLPVFEISPSEQEAWLRNNAKITKSSLFIEGDGAQSSLNLTLTKKPNIYELRITSLEDSTIHSYILERIAGGWFIRSRQIKTP